MAAEGKTDVEIANLLVASPRTVQTHMAHIHSKLGVKSRTAAAALAFRAASGESNELAA